MDICNKILSKTSTTWTEVQRKVVQFKTISVNPIIVKQCTDTLIRNIKNLNQNQVFEQLESLSQSSSLGFTKDGQNNQTECKAYLHSDDFYFEIPISLTGEIGDIKFAMFQELPQSSKLLKDIFCSWDWELLLKNINGIKSIYLLNDKDRTIRENGFKALQFLESDLSKINNVQKHYFKNIIELVNESKIGLFRRSDIGHAMKLYYYCSPQDLIFINKKAKEFIKNINEEIIFRYNLGSYLTISLRTTNSSKFNLPNCSLLTTKYESDLDRQDLFDINKDYKSFELPGTFLITFNKPIVMSYETFKAIQNEIGIEFSELNDQPKLIPYFQLLAKTAHGKILHDSYSVQLPEETQVYYITESDYLGIEINNIPFTHPNHLPYIIDVLRKQLLLNELLLSCMRKSCSNSCFKNGRILEISLISPFALSVIMQHPTLSCYTTIEIDVSSEKIETRFRDHSNLHDPTLISEVIKRCHSIPVTMRAILMKYKQTSVSLDDYGDGNGNTSIQQRILENQQFDRITSNPRSYDNNLSPENTEKSPKDSYGDSSKYQSIDSIHSTSRVQKSEENGETINKTRFIDSQTIKNVNDAKNEIDVADKDTSNNNCTEKESLNLKKRKASSTNTESHNIDIKRKPIDGKRQNIVIEVLESHTNQSSDVDHLIKKIKTKSSMGTENFKIDKMVDNNKKKIKTVKSLNNNNNNTIINNNNNNINTSNSNNMNNINSSCSLNNTIPKQSLNTSSLIPSGNNNNVFNTKMKNPKDKSLNMNKDKLKKDRKNKEHCIIQKTSKKGANTVMKQMSTQVNMKITSKDGLKIRISKETKNNTSAILSNVILSNNSTNELIKPQIQFSPNSQMIKSSLISTTNQPFGTDNVNTSNLSHGIGSTFSTKPNSSNDATSTDEIVKKSSSLVKKQASVENQNDSNSSKNKLSTLFLSNKLSSKSNFKIPHKTKVTADDKKLSDNSLPTSDNKLQVTNLANISSNNNENGSTALIPQKRNETINDVTTQNNLETILPDVFSQPSKRINNLDIEESNEGSSLANNLNQSSDTYGSFNQKYNNRQNKNNEINKITTKITSTNLSVTKTNEHESLIEVTEKRVSNDNFATLMRAPTAIPSMKQRHNTSPHNYPEKSLKRTSSYDDHANNIMKTTGTNSVSPSGGNNRPLTPIPNYGSKNLMGIKTNNTFFLNNTISSKEFQPIVEPNMDETTNRESSINSHVITPTSPMNFQNENLNSKIASIPPDSPANTVCETTAIPKIIPLERSNSLPSNPNFYELDEKNSNKSLNISSNDNFLLNKFPQSPDEENTLVIDLVPSNNTNTLITNKI